MDVVVTVPKTFRHPAAPGRIGLAAWLAEGDPAGSKWTGNYWLFTTYGAIPDISTGERVYVACEGRLIGYAPLHRLVTEKRSGLGRIGFIRGGGAVACTISEPITGFRGWRYRWWDRENETLVRTGSEHK